MGVKWQAGTPCVPMGCSCPQLPIEVSSGVLTLPSALEITDVYRGRLFTDGDDASALAASLGWQGRRLDATGYFWMGARYYDSTMGRFLSPDPKGFSEGPNLYGYANGDPINKIDADGRGWFSSVFKSIGKAFKKVFKAVAKFVKKYWRPILSIAVAFVAPYALGLELMTLEASIVGGFFGGAISGGVKGAFFGAASAYAFWFVGHAQIALDLYKKVGTMSKAAAHITKSVGHGLAGGLSSAMQGAKFEHGFLSAFVTNYVGPDIDTIKNQQARLLTAAVIGGTVSEVAGGEFQHGAVTSVFSRWFNDEAATWIDPATGKWYLFGKDGTTTLDADGSETMRTPENPRDYLMNRRQQVEAAQDVKGGTILKFFSPTLLFEDVLLTPNTITLGGNVRAVNGVGGSASGGYYLSLDFLDGHADAGTYEPYAFSAGVGLSASIEMGFFDTYDISGRFWNAGGSVGNKGISIVGGYDNGSVNTMGVQGSYGLGTPFSFYTDIYGGTEINSFFGDED